VIRRLFMRNLPDPRALLAAGPLVALLALAPALQPTVADEQGPALAAKAREILNTRCFKCHGQNGVASGDLFVLDRDCLVMKKKAVVPKEPANSELIKQIESGAMPAGGPKLPEEEIKALKA